MLERRSALATAHPFSWAALTLGEVRNFTLSVDILTPEMRSR